MAEQSSPPPIRFERDEDFASLYANHVFYENSVWDMKLVFGQLDQSEGPNVVIQHTAVAVSWLQLKLMIYFLQVNLAVHEAQNGVVKVPTSVMPPIPEPLTPELQTDATARECREKIIELHEYLAKSRL